MMADILISSKRIFASKPQNFTGSFTGKYMYDITVLP